MKVEIVELIEGAKQAQGLVVIIDVFRAFSLECYLFEAGVSKIFPVGSMETALKMKAAYPQYILIGERGGAKVEGCDYGNSPSQLAKIDLQGKTIIHTTSAGTQGIHNAVLAEEIITGSLVNAMAVAKYIRSKQPNKVYLVAMGNAGKTRAMEDVVCARYLKALIQGENYNIQEAITDLRHNGGEHFFNQETQVKYPMEDFYMCTKVNLFDQVLQVKSIDGIDVVSMVNN